MKRHLVIGLGQIGTAIRKIIVGADGCDPMKGVYGNGSYDVLHICFPFFEGFVDMVNDYRRTYDADLVIIHSTVPIGTSESIGLHSVASPCRGVHPNLVEGIRTFIKFFGGDRATEAAEIFEDYGIEARCTDDSRSVEAFKLWDTTMYGLNIIMQKEIKRFCEDNGLHFDIVYTEANQSYNDGYRDLGMQQYQKYIIGHRDGKIGGHCIIPNCGLLDSWISELIVEKNNEL